MDSSSGILDQVEATPPAVLSPAPVALEIPRPKAALTRAPFKGPPLPVLRFPKVSRGRGCCRESGRGLNPCSTNNRKYVHYITTRASPANRTNAGGFWRWRVTAVAWGCMLVQRPLACFSPKHKRSHSSNLSPRCSPPTPTTRIKTNRIPTNHRPLRSSVQTTYKQGRISRQTEDTIGRPLAELVGAELGSYFNHMANSCIFTFSSRAPPAKKNT